jgi:hypothetical protein
MLSREPVLLAANVFRLVGMLKTFTRQSRLLLLVAWKKKAILLTATGFLVLCYCFIGANQDRSDKVMVEASDSAHKPKAVDYAVDRFEPAETNVTKYILPFTLQRLNTLLGILQTKEAAYTDQMLDIFRKLDLVVFRDLFQFRNTDRAPYGVYKRFKDSFKNLLAVDASSRFVIKQEFFNYLKNLSFTHSYTKPRDQAEPKETSVTVIP